MARHKGGARVHKTAEESRSAKDHGRAHPPDTGESSRARITEPMKPIDFRE